MITCAASNEIKFSLLQPTGNSHPTKQLFKSQVCKQKCFFRRFFASVSTFVSFKTVFFFSLSSRKETQWNGGRTFEKRKTETFDSPSRFTHSPLHLIPPKNVFLEHFLPFLSHSHIDARMGKSLIIIDSGRISLRNVSNFTEFVCTISVETDEMA